jgi:hypothetical protein
MKGGFFFEKKKNALLFFLKMEHGINKNAMWLAIYSFPLKMQATLHFKSLRGIEHLS